MTKHRQDASGRNTHPINWCLTDSNRPVLPAGEVTCLVSQSTVTLATTRSRSARPTTSKVNILSYKR